MKESREQSRTTTHSCRAARPGGRGFGSQQPPRGRRAPVALVLALVVMIVVLAGCKIQIALDTKVSADGSGSIGVRLAADKEIQDLMAQQATEGDLFAEFTKQIPADWQTDSGTDADGTKWVSASKSFQDTAELDALLAGQAQGGLGGALAGDTFSITQSRGLFSVTTTFDATWDAGKALADAETGITDTVTPDMLSSVFLVENRLTLPGIIKDNNATEVEGNTLIWQPPLQGATQLHARSVAVRGESWESSSRSARCWSWWWWSSRCSCSRAGAGALEFRPTVPPRRRHRWPRGGDGRASRRRRSDGSSRARWNRSGDVPPDASGCDCRAGSASRHEVVPGGVALRWADRRGSASIDAPMVLIRTSALGRIRGVVRPAMVALVTLLLVTAVLAGLASTTPNRAAAASLTETKSGRERGPKATISPPGRARRSCRQVQHRRGPSLRDRQRRREGREG